MRMIDLYVDAGMDVIALVDLWFPNLSRHFKQILADRYTELLK